eukprot:436804_1
MAEQGDEKKANEQDNDLAKVAKFPTVFMSCVAVHSDQGSKAEDSTSVVGYGRGQLSGAYYTVPAHGKAKVTATITMQSVTPDSIAALNSLVESMLKASKKGSYEKLKENSVSGGSSFFSFLSGGVKASHKDMEKNMKSWGLSEENISKITTQMCEIANKSNTFTLEADIDNSKYDYSVSGNLFAVVMDCEIKTKDTHIQQRYIAPQVNLISKDGAATLPVTKPLY